MIAERLRSEANEFVPLFEEQRRRHLADPYPTLAERIKRLDALERAILAHRGDVATAIAADFGKSKDETEFSEIVLTLAELRLARRNLARWAKPRRVATPLVVAPATSERRFEPRGVVLVMGPFNYPFQLAIVPLVAALAAGNRAIVRLSEKVPNTRAVVATILAEAFAPTEVACVGGEIAAAQALLDLPFDHFFFTGSSAVGKIVMGAAARHLASVTLELGGKSPAIVHADADVDVAASRIAFGKYANAGQTCIAPDYALVHETVARAFVAREMTKHFEQQIDGTPAEILAALERPVRGEIVLVLASAPPAPAPVATAADVDAAIDALLAAGMSPSHAAKELGLTRAALYRRMARHGL